MRDKNKARYDSVHDSREYISRYKVWCKRPPVLWPWYTNQREESPLGPLFFLRDPHGDCFTMSRLGTTTTRRRILSQATEAAVHCCALTYPISLQKITLHNIHTYLLTQHTMASFGYFRSKSPRV